MAYGPGESRFVEEKRHFEKPIPISDLVLLDRERCILCDRCTRFAKEVAGDPLIHFIDRGNQHRGQHLPRRAVRLVLQRQHRADLPGRRAHRDAVPLQGPPVGPRARSSRTCTAVLGRLPRRRSQSSRNEVLRYQGVDIDPVNWGWLCDKGRFDFEAVEQRRPPRRAARARRRRARRAAPLGRRARRAADAAARGRRPRRPRVGRASSAAPGSPTRTPTPGPSWPRACIGTDNVDAQLGDGLPAEVVLGLPRATIDEACAPGGTVLAARPRPQGGAAGPVPAAPPRRRATTASRSSSSPRGHRPDAARRRLAAPPPRRGGRRSCRRSLAGRRHRREVGGVDADALAAAAGAARRRARHRRPRPAVAWPSRPTASSTPPRPRSPARPDVRFLSALRRANVHGALDMGLAPGLLPGRVALDDGRALVRRRAGRRCPPAAGLDTDGHPAGRRRRQHRRARAARRRPARRLPRPRPRPTRALAGARTVIAVDHVPHRVARRRPTSCCRPPASPRCDGTTTNLEGRVSAARQQVTPPGTARPDWMIAAELACRLGADLGFDSVGDDLGRDRAGSPRRTRAHRRALADAAADGVVLPAPASSRRRSSTSRGRRRPPRPSRPSRPPRPTTDEGDADESPAEPGRRADAPSSSGFVADAPPAPPLDAYSLPAGGHPQALRPGHRSCSASPLAGRPGARHRRCACNPYDARPPRRRRRATVGRTARPRSPRHPTRRAPCVPGRPADARVGDRRATVRHRAATSPAVPPPATLVDAGRRLASPTVPRASPPSTGGDPDARRRPAPQRRRRPRRGADRPAQGRRRLRVPARGHHVHGLVRAQGHRRHAEPHRPEHGRARSASSRPSPTASSSSSRRTCSPTGPSARVFILAPFLVVRARVPAVRHRPGRRRLHQRQRRHRRDLRPRHLPAARRPADRHPASCSPCRRSPSTASCSPAGRRARSTRCSASVRASAQMVSYEAALGLSVVRRGARHRLALSTHDIVVVPGRRRLGRHHPELEPARHRASCRSSSSSSPARPS